MKLTVRGTVAVQNTFCWSAITSAIEDWNPLIAGSVIEAVVYDDNSILKLTLHSPSREPVSTEIDICWIAYADQADRLALQTNRALAELEGALSHETGDLKAA